ncbi:hypothetical protein [Paraburkholderia ferrariae]|uniref:hypothetical protein n=1 Tax=Paraburkholderia ferrariae TaxID=386056 RepID=UPI00146FF149|nr:hypothetical protein [Paraburkholderia ferrariae]
MRHRVDPNDQNFREQRLPDGLTASQQRASRNLLSVIAIISVVCLADFVLHWSSPDWRGLSHGVFGGIIGIFPYVYRLMLDDNSLTLNERGRGPARDGHIAYLRGRLTIGIASGFVMSSLAASFYPHCTSACLVAFGILGASSPRILENLADTISGTRRGTRSKEHDKKWGNCSESETEEKSDAVIQ